MGKRTKQLAVMPWDGGLVTAHDPSLLPPNQLTNADNITVRFSHDKTRRDGINYNWDNTTFNVTARSSSGVVRTLVGSFINTGISVGETISIAGTNQPYGSSNPEYDSTGVVSTLTSTILQLTTSGSYHEDLTDDDTIYWSNKVIGLYDYWFQTDVTKAHWIISVLDNGMVFASADGGVRHRLHTIGQKWTIAPPLSLANMETINNILVIAVDGVNNQMVYWNGDLTVPLQDLPDLYNGIETDVGGGTLIRTKSIEKSSSGTTRTIKFDTALLPFLQPGDTIIIKGDDPNYIGTFTALTVTGSEAVVTYTALTPLTQSTTADTTFNIGSFAPLSLNLRQHLGVLWVDDRTKLDEVHYSGQDIFSWGINGTSDLLSGATIVGDGDGDPKGVSGISPSFQGALFIGKRTKLYRIDATPGNLDSLVVVKVSDDIGFLSHQSVCAVEQTDLVFVSERGVHSMTTTNAYGNFLSNYLSKDINRTFSTDFTAVRKPFIKICYVPEISAVLMAVSDNQGGFNNAVYGYNLDHKYWYRWTGLEAESMCTSLDNSLRTLYLGGYRTRLLQTLTGLEADIYYDGSTKLIPMTVTTGNLYMGNFSSLKLFKELRIFVVPKPNFTIVVTVSIDNAPAQSLVFSSSFSAVPLGQMILGFDTLGKTSISEPYAQAIDGQGRSIKITFSQIDNQEPVGILGYAVDYVEGDKYQETIDNDS